MFRICNPMCYAINLVPGNPLSVVSNYPYDEDACAASWLTQASYPELNLQIEKGFYTDEKHIGKIIPNVSLLDDEIEGLLERLEGITGWLRKLGEVVVDTRHRARFEEEKTKRVALYDKAGDKLARERIEYLVLESGVIEGGIQEELWGLEYNLNDVLNDVRDVPLGSQVTLLINEVFCKLYTAEPDGVLVSINWIEGVVNVRGVGEWTSGIDVLRWKILKDVLNVTITPPNYAPPFVIRDQLANMGGVWDDVIKMVAEKMKIIKEISVNGTGSPRTLDFKPAGEATAGGSGGSKLAMAATGLALLAALLAA